LKEDNKINDLTKRYKFRLQRDSNPDPSHGTGITTIAPPQEELRCSVQIEEFLSIYTKNVRADRKFTHLLAKIANIQKVFVHN
jgi:hypothetical protein